MKKSLSLFSFTSLGLFILLSGIVFGCENDPQLKLSPDKSALVQKLYMEAQDLHAKAAFDSALVKTEMALKQYHSESAIVSPLLLQVYKFKGDCLLQLRQPDKVISLVDSLHFLGKNKLRNFTDEAIGLANLYARALDEMGYSRKAKLVYDSILMAFDASILPLELAWTYEGLGSYFGRNNELDLTKEYYEKAAEIRREYASKDSLQLFKTFYAQGQILIAQGDYQRAVDQLEKSLNVLENHNGSIVQRSNIYWTLGLAYQGLLDYSRAEAYLLRAMEYLNSVRAPDHPDVIILYSALGGLFNKMNDFQKALSYFEKTIPLINNRFVADDISLGILYHNAGLSYANLGKFDHAEEYFKNAVSIFEKHQDVDLETQKFLFNTHSKLALLEYYRGNYEGTVSSYWDQITALENFYGKESPELVEALNNLGITYDEMKEYDKAIELYSRQLDILGVKTDKLTPFENMIFPISAQYALWNRAEAYFSWFTSTEDEIYLQKALKDYELSVDFLDHMRLGYWEEGSKENFAKENKVVYERVIRLNTYLQSDITEPIVDEKTFSAFEKSRSLLILENFRKNKVTELGNVTPEIQEKEEMLKKAAEAVDNRLFLELSKAHPNVKEVNNLRKERFQKMGILNTFLARLAKEAPNYYKLKYNVEPFPLATLQKELGRQDAALLEYFIINEGSYVLVVLPDSIYIHFLGFELDLQPDIQNLRESIYGHWLNPRNSKSVYRQNAEVFVQSASKLYETLIQPVDSLLPERLIIVQDDVLGNLPFEVLLTEMPAAPEAFYDHPYLIMDHQISYAYSATTLLEMMAKKHQKKAGISWLGMAPAFSKKPISDVDTSLHTIRKGLEPLKYTETSIKEINGLLKGEIFLGKQASKRTFLEFAKNSKLIHLAGHAEANDENGELSWIAFADNYQKAEDIVLFVKELYQLRLNADMVVLSTCQSGIGEFQTGEGVISLGRAFSYAGAKSIIHTLWNVGDEASQQLNLLFYKNLMKGWSKDKALRQAKLTFIKEKGVEGKFDPFFWAGFVALGDMSAIF